MSPALTTFVFEAANFLVPAGVLGWLFFRPVRDAIARRRAALQQQTDQAAAALADARQLQTEIEQQFAALEQELNDHRSQAHASAQQQAEDIIAAARDSVWREADVARHRLAHLERGRREHLARIVAQTAGATVDRLLRRIGQLELQHALTAAACRELQSLEETSLAPVRIESAQPLDDADRTALLAALGPAADSAEFRVTEYLGVGLRIVTNRGLVDVSSAGLSTFADNLLARQLSADNHADGSSHA